MLIGHRDNRAVVRCHLIEIRSALAERGTLGHGCARASGSQREHGHRLPGGGEHVYALMPVL